MFVMNGQGFASDDFLLDRIYVPMCFPDYGDAPDSYGDAGHAISPTITAYLGSTVPDPEIQTQNSANGGSDGTGDDTNDSSGTSAGNDEDGVSTFPTLSTTTTGNYDVSVVCNGDGANVYGWLDFNDNDSFADTGEFAFTTCSDSGGGASDGSATLSFSGYTMAASAGTTYARIRTTTDALSNTDSASSASDGEVEDYELIISVSSDITKTTSTPSITLSELATYTITVNNNNSIQVDGVVITDTPEDSGFFYNSSTITLLDNNTGNVAPTRTATSDPSQGDNPMSWGTFSIPAGDAVQIQVNMDVFSGTGTYDNSVTATSTTGGVTINDYDGTDSGNTGEDVTVVNLICNASSEAKIFYGSANGDIYSTNLATGAQKTLN